MIFIWPARTNNHCALSHRALRSTNTQTTGVRQMKLVELLALELREWPERATMAVQDNDGQIKMAAGYEPRNGNGQYGTWIRDEEIYHAIECYTHKLATDHATAIVTRADWEAEKARIAGKVDGGWKRHKRKSQPVSDGAIVEILTRGGEYETCEASCFSWGATGNSQIMAYRIHNPAEQPAIEPAVVENVQAFNAQAELLYDPVAQGPLQWRDRIRTLDTQRAELEATYQCQIGEIDWERGELVERLAGEGLALVEVVQPVEDMDWREWRKGDVVMCVSQNHKWSEKAELGAQYRLSEDPSQDDEHGLNIWVAGLYMNPADFKWHSRPGK